jgi:hypothetical protein
MAVNSFDPVTGSPRFVDTDAPDIKVDPQKAAEYAADVGNRIMRANLAALDAYPYKRKGLRGKALDTMIEYEHTGSSHVPVSARLVGRVKRSSSATTFPSSGYTNVAANTFWTADVNQGVASYNAGWTIPITSRYLVEYEIRATGSFLAGITVNYAGASPSLILTSTPAAVQGIAAATVSATVKLTAGDVIRPYLLASTGTPAWVENVGFFAFEWVGVD